MDIESAFVGAMTRVEEAERGKIITQHIQDTDPVAKQCKENRLENWNGWSDGRTLKKVGGIPSIFLQDYKYKDIMSDDKPAFKKAVKRFFTDHPEFLECNGNI